MSIRKTVALFSPADLVSISFLLFLSVLNLAFLPRIPEWPFLVGLNIIIAAVIATLAVLAETRKTPLLIGFHRWYLYPVVLFIFKELYYMIRPIHPADYDWLLISIDRWMFGVDPTVWLSRYATPILTEILQIAYSSYYLLFIVLGIEIYRRHTLKSFDRAGFMIVYGFYLSYLGYFLLPAVGPRFTLHDFAAIDQELPGLLVTGGLRAFVNFGESVPTHVPNPVDFVQRDVFPSGHTQLTLIVLYLAFHFKLSSRWVLMTFGGFLIVGTVYLRYHYVVDVLGGLLFFLFTIWSGHRIEKWWNEKRYALSGNGV